MGYSDIVATIAMIVSISAVPASGYLSYRYAIKGEKRKEWNAITDPLRTKLREQLRLLDQGSYPACGSLIITDDEIDKFLDVSHHKKQEAIQTLWRNYQDSLVNCGHDDDDGFYRIHDSRSVISAIALFLPLLKRT